MSFDEFVKFIADRYGMTSEEIKKTQSFGELGLDSLSLFTLVSDIEEEFKLSINVDDLTQVDTIEKMYDFIKASSENNLTTENEQ